MRVVYFRGVLCVSVEVTGKQVRSAEAGVSSFVLCAGDMPAVAEVHVQGYANVFTDYFGSDMVTQHDIAQKRVKLRNILNGCK